MYETICTLFLGLHYFEKKDSKRFSEVLKYSSLCYLRSEHEPTTQIAPIIMYCILLLYVSFRFVFYYL